MKKVEILFFILTVTTSLAYCMQPEIVQIDDPESIEPVEGVSHYKMMYESFIHNCVGPHGALTTYSHHNDVLDTMVENNSVLQKARDNNKLIYFLFDEEEQIKKVFVTDDEIPMRNGMRPFIDPKTRRKVRSFRIRLDRAYGLIQFVDMHGNLIFSEFINPNAPGQKTDSVPPERLEELSDRYDFSNASK